MTDQNCFWMTPEGRSQDVLLRHIPLGRAWLGFRTAGKRAFRMLAAIAGVFEEAWGALCTLATELNPYQTTDLIADWETALSLPDACLPSATTLDQRRTNILFRLAKKRWTTAQDWIDLAALFGLTIQVTPGWHVQRRALFGSGTPAAPLPPSFGAEWEFPLNFDIFPRLGRFRVYIDVVGLNYAGFEYGGGLVTSEVGFPIPFGETNSSLLTLQCIFDRIRPANVVIIWNNNPLRGYCYAESFTDSFSDTFCSTILDSETF